MRDKEKFKNKYRIRTTRLKGYNYSQDGVYFVTICTHSLEEYFGEIITSKVNLNALGRITQEYWISIPKHFPFVKLDEFVIMPNHIHGIIIINKTQIPVETQYFASLHENIGKYTHSKTQNIVSLPRNVGNHASLHNELQIRQNYKNKFGPQSSNLASIIRGFKSSVTKWTKINRQDFKWQSRYYDRIIRDIGELENTRAYIRNNPAQWQADKDYTPD